MSSFPSFSLRRSLSVPTPAPVALLATQPTPSPLSSLFPTFPGQFEAAHPSSHSHQAPATTRAYKPRGNIHESSYRPPVRASERLFNWRTPHGLDADEKLEAAVPPGFAGAIRARIQSCYAPNMMTTYGAGLLRFTEFCDKYSIPEVERMPASWPLLCAFINEHHGKVSGNTIKTWLAAIHTWHDVNQAAWYGDHTWVTLSRTAAKRDGTRFWRPLRAPVSMQHLLVLRKAIRLTDSFHAAVWAVAVTAFFSCRRLGELTVPSAGRYDPKYHPPASTPISFSTFNQGTRSASFRVPWTKTKKEEGASVIVTARDDLSTCPVHALQIHRFITNKDCPPDRHIFSYHSPTGEWMPMVKKVFLDFCDSVWKDAGLEHVLGHSFRIGGAVELLLAGVNPDIVAATGGWESLSFLLYWRRMEEIIPLSTSKAYSKAHVEELTSIFESFRVRHKISRTLVSDALALD